MAPEMFGGVADVLHLELTNIGIMVLLGIQYASWILLLIFGHQFPLFTFTCETPECDVHVHFGFTVFTKYQTLDFSLRQEGFRYK